MIDLHIHSTASDGALTPVEILSLALEKKIEAISITDHDSVEGVRELVKIGIPKKIGFLSGIEISASPPALCASQGSIHILGYGIDVENPALDIVLQKLRDARKNRNPKIIQKLNRLGFPVKLEDVEKLAGDCQLSRPHIAQYLFQKGFVDSMDEAFDRYLAKGKPAYADKFRISCQEAIQLIHNAGGLPVLAHPYLIKAKKGFALEDIVVELISMGLEGIEVYYPQHPPGFMNDCFRMTEKHDLFVTGGTDFHGDIKPEIKLGTGLGNLCVPFEIFQNIKKRLIEPVPAASSHDFSELIDTIRYEFSNPDFLKEALCHSSYVNENPAKGIRDNERLEFLGDAVLNLTIAAMLMKNDSSLHEGELSRIRASLVNESQLAELARKISLGNYLMLGKGELITNGREKNSILADAFEALIAAIFLDGGFEHAEAFVKKAFGDLIEDAALSFTFHDFKSRLQEIVQTRQDETPQYHIIEETGPDHDKTFCVQVAVFGMIVNGTGKSKKAAEQQAARMALELLAEP